MKRIGVVGVNGGWSSERLLSAVENKTGYRLMIELDKVVFDVETGKAWYRDVELNSLDAIVVKKIGRRYSPSLMRRMELLRYLHEMVGLPVFSTPDAMIRAVDRMNNTLTLRGAGIPMPPTRITEDIDEAVAAMKRFKTSILKPLYSSKTRGMMIVEENADHFAQAGKFRDDSNSIFYIQKLLDAPGQNFDMVFMGGEYVASYTRGNNDSAYITDDQDAGRYKPVAPDDDVIKIAHMAQAAFGLDFTSVDVVMTEKGPFVFEVTAFGGFRGLSEAHGIDAADLYADYVLDKIS